MYGFQRVPFQGRGQGTPNGLDPPATDADLIRELIGTLGASALNTNNQLANTAQQMAELAVAIRDSQQFNDGGYKSLKPKKDITKITAADAKR